MTVVYGPRELDLDDPNSITNPTLLVEILSRSTEEYDRGDKFEHYKRIPSLREYVLVSYRTREVEVWTRTDADTWSQRVYRDGECAPLASIDASLDVRELYEAAEQPT